MNYIALALSTLRHLLTASGGALAATAGQSDEQFFVGLVAIVIGQGYSYVRNYKAAE